MIFKFKLTNEINLNLHNFFNLQNIKLIEYDKDNLLEKLVNNINELNNNLNNTTNNLKEFFNFLKSITYWLIHPIEFLKMFQSWIIILLIIMIVLKMIGFNTDKWFRLFFLLFFISLIL